MRSQSESKLDTRQRLIFAVLDLLRTQGLAAASVREAAKHAQTPLGSTYHYFPDGKPQMVKEALLLSGNIALKQLDNALNQHGLREGIAAFIAWWGGILQDSAFQAGCPLMSVLMETGNDDEKAQYIETVTQVLDLWKQRLTQAFEQEGIAFEQATQASVTVIASFEGAVLLCRAWGNLTPLQAVTAQLDFTDLLRNHLTL